MQQTEKIESEERLASEYQTSDTSIGYPPGLTRERFISFARNTVNRGIMQKHETEKRTKPRNREKDKISIFTTRSYSNRNTATFANILFPNLVNNRNREKDEIDLSIRSVRSDTIQVN
jgi:hypothetical protein